MLKLLKKGTSLLGLFVIVLMCLTLTVENISAKSSDESKTAKLRLIFTTDIHGQLNSTDYETGGTLSVGGLARAYSLIKQARGEESNYLTFDIGDVLYDYTTEYIYGENQKTLQPIYQAMSDIGYDAITLGNHEFDYDYDYVVSQLKSAGLFDKVVISNLTDSKTGAHPFLENQIITKNLTTTDGGTLEVKVGVIGETLPVLSSKAQNFTGVLKVQDIVENVTAQAAALKSQGADVIVVLAHSGMGVENPAYGDKNVSYALTKIDDVDVVLCGHEHNAFPSDDKSGAYYKLPGIDKETNLVNGKNIVMAQDRGESIGVVDLTLGVEEGEVVINGRSSELRRATSTNTVEDPSISGLYDEYSAGMLEYTKEEIGSVSKDALIENFNGLVEDNTALQLVNDAKRSYAMNYIFNKSTDYLGYPVIAASTYISYGANGYQDFVNISGSLTESDLASLQGYNGYTAIYEITGAQLKEWLEWSASAYVQTTQKASYSGSDISSFVNSSGVESLVAKDWLDDWSTFYIFDGIEYTINPMIAPRYNHAGVKIDSTQRVTELTYNGKAVTDNQVFVLACGKLAKTTDANKGIDKQGIYKGYVRTQGIIRDYIQQRCKLGELVIQPDYNWSLKMPVNYEFLVKTTSIGEQQLKDASWFAKKLGVNEQYIYSVGSFAKQEDKGVAKIMLSETYTDATSEKVKVAVSATSRNTITEVKYTKGECSADSPDWTFANKVENGYFYADSNGIYTVYAVDKAGNASTEQIKIDNIYSGILKKPSVNTYTNRKTKISGKAEPASTVVIQASGNTYKTTADTNGNFSYALPAQKSGTKVSLYAVDEKNNYLSEVVTVNVKRTGPNKPKVEGIYNNSDQVRGNLNDTDASIIAIVGNMVYVGDEATAKLYQNCKDLYSDKNTVVVTSVRVDAANDYMFTVPVQKIGTSVKIYTIDHINRASMVNTVTVKDCAPNPPVIYALTAADNRIEGMISSSKANTVFSVYITVNNKNYTTYTDKTGYFCVEVDPSELQIGSKVSVYAKDKVNEVNRSSYISVVTVEDPEKYVSENNDLILDDLYTGDFKISGWNDSQDEITIGIKSAGSYRVYKTQPNSDGVFTVNLTTPLNGGDMIYAHTTSANGEILDMVKAKVEMVVPDVPIVDDDITNLTKTVIVYTDVEGKAVVKIGNTVYESSDYFYNDVEQMYQFNVTIPQTVSGTKVSVYAYNDAGKSAARTMTVLKVVPEAPVVNKVYTTTKKIKGTIGIVGDTVIYAKIGSETYTGTVKADGSFVIEIPKQAKGKKIVVWGENETGKGFTTTVEVKKKANTEKLKNTEE